MATNTCTGGGGSGGGVGAVFAQVLTLFSASYQLTLCATHPKYNLRAFVSLSKYAIGKPTIILVNHSRVAA